MCGFKGDFFGKSTTSSATLSGETNFFGWPLFNSVKTDFKKFIGETPNETILGAALEWKKDSVDIAEKIKVLRENNIPSILNECNSSFWKGNKENFVLSGKDFEPDMLYFSLGPQVSVLACQPHMFIEKPLALISTWDGDEHGLCLFQDHVFSSLEGIN
jgi:hypothetical protein